MTNKLSKKRAKWVKQFKPQAIKGAPLQNNSSAQVRYEKELKKLVTKMVKTTEREITKLYKSPDGKAFFTMDGSIASQARILMNTLTAKFDEMFGSAAKVVAPRMINDVNKSSKVSLANSLKDLAGMTVNTNVNSADLVDTMKSSIAQNVQLIKSIPAQYLEKVGGSVFRSITSGQGLADLEPQIKRFGVVTEKRAAMIAIDQTRKAYSSINADRLNKIGIKQFEWVHSAGSRFPREDHMELNGQIFSFDNLPVIDKKTGERGLPAQAPNCRCVMRPILSFNDGSL